MLFIAMHYRGYTSLVVNYELYTSLAPNVYSCLVCLITLHGIKCILSPNPVPSGPPLSFQATPVNSTSLQLNWEPPAREKRNGIIRKYLINATALESGEHFQWLSITTSLVVSGLHPHYHYNLIIAAITTGPSGPFSDVHSVLTPEDGNCNAKHIKTFLS